MQNPITEIIQIAKSYDKQALSSKIKQHLNSQSAFKENWIGLANLANKFGLLDDAKQCLAMVDANNLDMSNWNQLIEQLSAAGQFKQARDLTELKTKQNPEDPGPQHTLATMLMIFGEMERAFELFQHVIQKSPQSGSSWISISDIANKEQVDTLIEQLQEVLRYAQSQGLNKYLLEHAMANLLLKQQQPDLALAYYKKANEGISKLSRYNDAFDTLASENLASYQYSPNTKKLIHTDCKPIFILGFPRSGTTLMQQLVGASDSVVGGGELNILDKILFTHLKGKSPIQSNLNWLDSLTEQQLNALRQDYSEYAQAYFGKSGLVIDKSLTNIRHYPIIKTLFPDAKCVWTERETDEVKWSCFKTHFSRSLPWSNSVSGINRYFQLEQQNVAKVSSYYDGYQVNFEDFRASPETQYKALLDYLELPEISLQDALNSQKSEILTASVTQVRARHIFAPEKKQLWPLLDSDK